MEKKVTLQSDFEKPFVEFPTHTKEFMNKVNERANGTDPKYVGVIDDLFLEYYLESLDNQVEINPKTWKEFHKTKKSTRSGKAAVKRKLREMKAAIRSITNEMIEEWYDFFLYEQTFYGKHQEFLIKEYFEEMDISVEINRTKISTNKIDLVIGGINCQVK